MSDSYQFTEKPAASEIYLICGWQQWADAGNVSSGLPRYLVEVTGARKIGEMESGPYYLFQLPGTHHFMRPEIKLEDGHRARLSKHQNEFYYAEVGGKGLVIFLGEEPHLEVDRYAAALIDAAKLLNVKRGLALGGVFAAQPYDKAREVHCAFSLPSLREDLGRYAVQFSNYEGGVTVSTYLLDRAEAEGFELASFYAFVPAYDLSTLSEEWEGIRIDEDHRAWHEVMRRVNHLFGLGLDLTDLARKSKEVTADMAEQLAELQEKNPESGLAEYLRRIDDDFEEKPFMAFDGFWEEELGDILKGLDG